MNIFAISDDPVEAAIFQHDRHVVKMTLESAQMISTAICHHPLWALEIGTDDYDALYKSSHKNHPCNVWVRDSIDNLMWLSRHGVALANEYKARFGKNHASLNIILVGMRFAGAKGGDAALHTGFATAMPDLYKTDDPVRSYKTYYVAEKCRGNTWRRSLESLPGWLRDFAEEKSFV